MRVFKLASVTHPTNPQPVATFIVGSAVPQHLTLLRSAFLHNLRCMELGSWQRIVIGPG
jgi:hypothetical protein